MFIEILNKLFNKENGSKELAKKRLQLVIMHDNESISPDLLEKLKEEILTVISRRLEIEKDDLEINLERADSSVALYASIPVKQVQRRKKR